MEKRCPLLAQQWLMMLRKGVMSFDAFRRTQHFFQLNQDTHSRDSGIVVLDSKDMSNGDGENVMPDTCEPTVSSPNRTFFDLDEGIEELILSEITNERNDGGAFAESLRQLSENGFSKESNRAFQDITNSMEQDESPKSHLSQGLKRSRLHDFNFRVSRRTSKMFAFDNTKCVRKRNLEITPEAQKKMKNVRNDNEKASATKARQSNLHTFLRAQSSSAVECEPCSLNQRNNLPQPLHVDYSLETLSKPQIESVAFKSISGEVVAKLMTTMSDEEFLKKFILVDCRYPYEYDGGHVRGAINIYKLSQVQEVFFPTCSAQFKETSAKIPIFYCEYSQKRGPGMAHALRQADRERNEHRYPDVDYKEIYLLDRGYKKFFEGGRFTHLCEPPAYTKMIASSHKDDLKRYHMHKSKSTTSISFKSFNTARDLPRLRNRFTRSADDAEIVFNEDKENEGPKLLSQQSPTSRKPRRANMFGSPFTPPKSTTPEKLADGPIPLATYS